MKVRSGFVSNSSSSSFTIKLKDITAKQLKQIKNHLRIGQKLGMDYCQGLDAWNIQTTEETYDELNEVFDSDVEVPDDIPELVTGFTCMDNFDMREFLSKISVPDNVIIWG